MLPKVTIIIPVYNAEKYIRKCLDSVRKQTLKEIEVLCIDDCSTDHSADQIKQMMIYDARFLLVHNETNMGAGETRNKGIMLAKGKYFFFLDSDDFLETDAIEKLYQCAERKELQLCFCPHAIYQEKDGHIRKSSQTKDVFLKRYENQVFSWKDVERFLYQNIFCVPWNRLYLTGFVRNSQIRFPALRNSEDFFFGEAVVTEAERMGVVESEKPLVYYRLGQEGQVSSTVGENPYCMLEAVKQLYDFLQAHHRLESAAGSYHTTVIDVLRFPVKSVENQRQVIRHIVEQGFLEIGMSGLGSGDFTNIASYKGYREFLEGRLTYYDIYNTGVMEDRKKLDMIGHFLDAHKREKTALWGMGKRGQLLLQNLENPENRFDYLIDADPAKTMGKADKRRIYRFEEVTEPLNYIMLTNARYFEEIYLRCKKLNHFSQIIDLDTFFQCDMTVEECMV